MAKNACGNVCLMGEFTCESLTSRFEIPICYALHKRHSSALSTA
jgi:hypothetical protein